MAQPVTTEAPCEPGEQVEVLIMGPRGSYLAQARVLSVTQHGENFRAHLLIGQPQTTFRLTPTTD